ncbi:MAG: methyltransferase domain-containing protein [Planctomycetota bacterium]
MTSSTVNTTYEPFALEPEYIEGNRQFIAELPLRPGQHVLDLACGVGTITKLLIERQPQLTILGLDLSRESLLIGRRMFQERGYTIGAGLILTKSTGNGSPRILHIEGTADRLPFHDSWADLVFMGHAIHMLPDYVALLKEIHRMLVPGGSFAFNSSFYAGSQAPGTDHFYQLWWKGASQFIIQRDAELRAQGKPGLKRERGKAPRAFSSLWPSADEWHGLLKQTGFTIHATHERTVMMTQRGLETIGSYSGLAKLMVSGYPVEIASEALVAAVAPAMKESGFDSVPRLWLEVVARKAQ